MANKTGAKGSKKGAKKAAKTTDGVGRKAERSPANQLATTKKMLTGISDKLARIQTRAIAKDDKATAKSVEKALKSVQAALQA